VPALEHEADNEAEEDSEERDSDGGGVRGRRDGIEADGNLTYRVPLDVTMIIRTKKHCVQ